MKLLKIRKNLLGQGFADLLVGGDEVEGGGQDCNGLRLAARSLARLGSGHQSLHAPRLEFKHLYEQHMNN